MAQTGYDRDVSCVLTCWEILSQNAKNGHWVVPFWIGSFWHFRPLRDRKWAILPFLHRFGHVLAEIVKVHAQLIHARGLTLSQLFWAILAIPCIFFQKPSYSLCLTLLNGTQIELYGISNSAEIQLATLIANFVKIAVFLKSFVHFKNFKSVAEIFQIFFEHFWKIQNRGCGMTC